MRLKAKFANDSQERLSLGLTGKEVAEKMLWDNGIYDIKAIAANGFLSDHYNLSGKTVNLSADVYNGANIAAAAMPCNMRQAISGWLCEVLWCR